MRWCLLCGHWGRCVSLGLSLSLCGLNFCDLGTMRHKGPKRSRGQRGDGVFSVVTVVSVCLSVSLSLCGLNPQKQKSARPKPSAITFMPKVNYLTEAFAMLDVTRVERFSAVNATPLKVQFSKVTAARGSIA